MGSLRENVERVREEVRRAAERVGRNWTEITIVAVTKTVAVERIEEALAAGLTVLGENRVQEAQEKIPRLFSWPDVRWHLIGHLQTNKVQKAASLFHMIQSVDSLKIAEKIDHYAAQSGRIMPVLVEVNLGSEPTKHGVAEQGLAALVSQASRLKNIRIKGLMTVPAYCPNPEDVRPFFKRLRALSETVRRLELADVEMTELSMGMSHDFTVAIEEGATMVRIGTAIFGERH
jgi:pyridoxal phosphate enzyme (YggS family)